jgi:hypothetical protein
MSGGAFGDMSRGVAQAAAAVAAIAVGAAAAVGAPREFSDDEVTAAVKAVIAERSKDGVFSFTDARTGDALALVFEDVRIVRGLPVFGWFPNVSFHDHATAAKKYTLDFWLKPDGDRLKLVDIRVHKAPRPDGAGWMSVTRQPLAWWWLPTMKRASAVAGMPAWQVMGTIHAQVADGANTDAIKLKDASGGEISLQLVDIEQPVGRSKTDNRYFACGVLRKFGRGAAFYSTAYWLDAKTKLVTAGSAKRLEEPLTGGSKAASEPRCDVGGITFDIVD